MKRAHLFLIVLVIGIIFFFSPLYPVFSFEETRTNNPEVYYINVSKEQKFNIRFTHSIHLTDVLESYEITENNQIKLHSMEYEDVAVGMPAHAEEDQTLSYENGKYKLAYKNKILDNFTIYIGDIDMDLNFVYDGQTYNMKKSLHRGSSYLFEVKTISLFDKLRGAVMVYEK
ncbi:DUF1850 domain-containing protein [Lysinibacillus halotolerans]|uniref:DUF1850 domain-containing protein n=1 Tax=Ureibacillus sp. FSL E2-3493 TaxID=2921367 RepID=UPI0031193272